MVSWRIVGEVLATALSLAQQASVTERARVAAMAERATALARAGDDEGLREAVIDILDWCLGNTAALSATLSDLKMSFFETTPEGPPDQQVLGLLSALVQVNVRSDEPDTARAGAPLGTEGSDNHQESGGSGSV